MEEGFPVEWINILKELGVTLSVLVALAWSARGIAVWFAREIIIPSRDRLIARLERFFDKTELSMDSLTENVRTVSVHMEKQTGALERIERQGCGGRNGVPEHDPRSPAYGPASAPSGKEPPADRPAKRVP